MLVPNIQRVIIKPILIDEIKSSGLVLAGQLKAGENLYYGEIIHPGTTKFKKGQGVFYSEYSAASLIDYRAVIEGTKKFSEVSKEGLVVVAEDDILAYDDSEISKTTKEN